MMVCAGDFKQEILRIYNAINKKMFNAGVKQQKVDFVGNKIIILSKNARVPVLKLLDESYPQTTRQLDLLLFQLIKQEIKEELRKQFQLNTVTVLKDYDTETELSGTIIILERDVEDYLNELPELR
ncbi:Na-translocating system protein MpsC family protein [Paenibacillus yonginensis]|nr:Na-translocating system protein MpsC family protein [Paenibacillus yonginensis]